MKLVLDTISAPATGATARRIVHAVKSGTFIVNAKGKAFIASLIEEMRPRDRKSKSQSMAKK